MSMCERQGHNTDGACVPVRTWGVICTCTGVMRLHTVPDTDFHKARMLLWHLFLPWICLTDEPLKSRRPERSTYSWLVQRYGVQTLCEKLCDCVLCLGWGPELHLREQENWLPVSVQTLLWVFCYASLWPFLKLTAFSSFAFNSNGF